MKIKHLAIATTLATATVIFPVVSASAANVPAPATNNAWPVNLRTLPSDTFTKVKPVQKFNGSDTKVVAVSSGTVISVKGGPTKVVKLAVTRNSEKLTITYLNLAVVKVKPGQKVTLKQPIGYVASVGEKCLSNHACITAVTPAPVELKVTRTTKLKDVDVSPILWIRGKV